MAAVVGSVMITEDIVFVLKQQMCSSSAEEVSQQIVPHPQIPDVLLLPVDGPRYVRNAGTASDTQPEIAFVLRPNPCLISWTEDFEHTE